MDNHILLKKSEEKGIRYKKVSAGKCIIVVSMIDSCPNEWTCVVIATKHKKEFEKRYPKARSSELFSGYAEKFIFRMDSNESNMKNAKTIAYDMGWNNYEEVKRKVKESFPDYKLI